MNLKTKKIIINISSAILILICILFAYLYGSGIIEVEDLKIEGIEMPQITAKTQTIVFSIVAVLNLVVLFLNRNLIRYKTPLIILEVVQALLGSILNIIGAAICIPILCIKTKDVEEEKKTRELPVLEEIKPKSKWFYFTIWLVIFVIGYTPIVNYLTDSLNPIITLIIIMNIYIIQIVLTFLSMKEYLKRDFRDFRKNFKTYFSYIMPKFGIFVLAYLIVAIALMVVVGEISTNQQELNSMPIEVTAILAIVIAPFLEEIMFRGLLKKILGNTKLYLIASSIIFGLLHVMFVEENWISYLYIIPYAMLGFLFAKVYSKTDNIFTNIFMHCAWNTMAVVLMVVTQMVG